MHAARSRAGPSPSGAPLPRAVTERPGVPTGLPSNALRFFCGFHEVFLEHVWLGLSCFNTAGLCSKQTVVVLRTFFGFREHVVVGP
eukprot:8743012-Pyramimonas_sp.AAC.1